MPSKSETAILLSKLNVFSSPKIRLEQYPTDSEIAAEILWNANLREEIKGKNIADLGCGTGVLGIGALVLGAKQVFFVDSDNASIDILRGNLRNLNIKKGYKIVNSDIETFEENVDLVLQNPPFGTKERHLDKLFLEKAMSLAGIIYSFHKTSTLDFIRRLAYNNGFEITNEWCFEFPLKQTLNFHTRRIKRIKVSCLRLEKSKRL